MRMRWGGWTRIWLIFSILAASAMLAINHEALRENHEEQIPLQGAGALGLQRVMASEVVAVVSSHCPKGKAHGWLSMQGDIPPVGALTPLPDNAQLDLPNGVASRDPFLEAMDSAIKGQPTPDNSDAVTVRCDEPPPFDWLTGLWHAAIPGIVLGIGFAAIGWIRAGFRQAKA